MSKTSKEILIRMISMWAITDTDFMGFYKDDTCKSEMLSYHHTKIAKCKGGEISISNGSILWRRTSHDYLHIIERYDKDLFKYLTKILVEVNDQLYLPNHSQIVRIDSSLLGFEREYCGEYTKNKNPIIKESFTKRLVK